MIDLKQVRKIYEIGSSAEAHLICKLLSALEAAQRDAAELREILKSADSSTCVGTDENNDTCGVTFTCWPCSQAKQIREALARTGAEGESSPFVEAAKILGPGALTESNTPGVYFRAECIFQYCPTPDQCIDSKQCFSPAQKREGEHGS